MFTVSIDPIIFTIGHFAVRWYALILITAIRVGVRLTASRIIAFGLTQSQIIALLGLAVGLALLAWTPRQLGKQTI